MAYGFQDCCNLSSYFYLTGIPASVQENEVFKIETLQGETFCGTYVKVPPLNYSVPTYTVVSLTEYDSCTNCETLGSNPCPAEESIFLSQFGTGTVATSTDCYLKTIFPLYVDCSPTVQPSNESQADGQLILYVIGGVPPYFFYSAGTFNTPQQQIFSSTPSTTPNSYLILDGIGDGSYSITVTDAQGNFFEDVTCILDSPPIPATLSCQQPVSTSMSYNGTGPADGSVSINIVGGTPPYTVTVQGTALSQEKDSDGTVTFNSVGAGNYTFTVTETAVPPFPANSTTDTCSVSLGPTPNYPETMCLSFFLCNQTNAIDKFYLTLIKDGNTTENFRPVYKLTLDSATSIGLSSNNTFRIKWINNTTGWGVVAANSTTANILWNTQPQNSCTFNASASFNLTSTYTGGDNILLSTPLNYSWAGTTGLMSSATGVVISNENCAVVSYLDETVNSFFICNTNNSSEVQISLGAVGGNGGPYTFLIDPPQGSNYTINTNILTLDENSPSGGYAVYAIDSSGAQSTNTTSFFLNFSCIGINVTASPTVICPNYEEIDGDATFTINLTAPTASAGISTTIDYPVTLYWRKNTVNNWNTITMNNSSQTVTVYGLPNPGVPSSEAGNYGAGTYEFYVEDANGDLSNIVTSTLTPIPCQAPAVSNPNVGNISTNCTTGVGSAQISWSNGEPPITIYYKEVDYEVWSSVAVNSSPYTLTNLNSADYEYYLVDSNGNLTSTNSFTVLPPAAVNIRIRTASALATALEQFGQYQSGNNSYDTGVYNNTLFDVGQETDFGLGVDIDPLMRNGYVRNPQDDIYSGPSIIINYRKRGIWRYPLLIEIFLDYTDNGNPLQGWFEIKTKVQTVYTSEVPAGLYNLDRLLVLRDYLDDPFNEDTNAFFNEYVWLNDVNYVNQTTRNFTQAQSNGTGYPVGSRTWYDFTPAGQSGNYPAVTGSFYGLIINNGSINTPNLYPKKKVDRDTYGSNTQFCESTTVYPGENPWKWSENLTLNDTSNKCTAISNFYVNFQKEISNNAGLPTVNPNLVPLNYNNSQEFGCYNYFTNFCATYFTQIQGVNGTVNSGGFSYNSFDAFIEANPFFDVGGFADIVDAADVIGSCSNDTTLTAQQLNGFSWNQTGRDVFLENFNGTSIIERNFTFGSASSPLTIDGNVVGGINYNSLGLKFEWLGVYQAYDYPNSTSCLSAKGLQFEVIFHPTNTPNCPGTNTAQEIKYFFRNPDISTYFDLFGIEKTEYIASMQVSGATSNRPNLFAHTSSLRIINEIVNTGGGGGGAG